MKTKGNEMTDQELLELAAKAAGIQYHSYVDSELFGQGINIGDVDVPLWNPLDDGGDALRLAVKLRINIMNFTHDIVAESTSWHVWEPRGNDDLATRRAIVRAAAEIGKNKEL